MYDILTIEDGSFIKGDKCALVQAAHAGDDMVLHIALDHFSEDLILQNIIIFRDDCIGLTYSNLAHGSLSPSSRVYNEELSNTLCVYSSTISNVVVHSMIASNTKRTVVHTHNKDYKRYVWRSTWQYKKSNNANYSRILKDIGGRFKLKVTFSKDVSLILKPNIVYFHDDGDVVVKSSQMLLPTEFANNIKLFAEKHIGFTEVKSFGSSYIAIFLSGKAVIHHASNCIADCKINKFVRKGIANSSDNVKEFVKEYKVDVEVLISD